MAVKFYFYFKSIVSGHVDYVIAPDLGEALEKAEIFPHTYAYIGKRPTPDIQPGVKELPLSQPVDLSLEVEITNIKGLP